MLAAEGSGQRFQFHILSCRCREYSICMFGTGYEQQWTFQVSRLTIIITDREVSPARIHAINQYQAASINIHHSILAAEKRFRFVFFRTYASPCFGRQNMLLKMMSLRPLQLPLRHTSHALQSQTLGEHITQSVCGFVIVCPALFLTTFPLVPSRTQLKHDAV